ncbi:MAG: glycosyltransferase [Actinobacteria bacterium]|nr:glycosyltransferase [Actinomycetota bacterium]MBV9252793.1 glycosyltransferase [Actinomycetota bacterium]
MPLTRTLLRSAVAAAAVVTLALVAHTDVVATAVGCLGALTVWLLLRRPSPSRPRRALVGLAAATTGVAVVAALTLPAFRSAPAPLVLVRQAGATATRSITDASQAGSHGFETLGFVDSSNEDSPAGVDRDASKVSILAATGIVLSRHPGSLEVTPATDSLLRAHASGALGLAVVSNYDGTSFDRTRATALLRSPAARHRFVSALTSVVARQGWDGVVLDFENLSPDTRASYPRLVRALDLALGDRRLDVTVPAVTDRRADDLQPYDVAALGRSADRIVLMAYDQHDPTGAAGPVAGLPWVRQSLTVAEGLVPRDKLLLGLAGYGYAWTSPGNATDLTVAQAQAMQHRAAAVTQWDAGQQEWHVHAGGDDVWYEDAAAVASRAQLAVTDGLAGVALWRIGSEDPATLDQLPAPAADAGVPTVGRAVQQVHGPGLVALTFDDGPDPTWTPRVLAVLRREHVPATFFVIGNRAQAHPDLVRTELREGDVVGDHTYSHPSLQHASSWRTRAEVLGGAAVIEGITGRKPELFRSPYGAGDMSPSRPGSDQLATDLGFHVVSWNDDSFDWTRPGPDAITRTVVSGVSTRSIVLLHDGGGDRSQTVAALPGIIHALRAQGFLFTTADAMNAAVPSPYAIRHGFASTARGVAVVAGYRLFLALRHILLWLVVAAVVVSLVRLAITVVLALGHWRRTRRATPRERHGRAVTPTVSVVIPAHNERRVIAKTLAVLRDLDDGPMEVIVVDDGSTDGTADIARRFGVTVLEQPRRGKATALNVGIGRARGEIVVVLDADTLVTPGFLAAMLPHFDDPSVGAVAGNVKVGNRRTLLARLQALEYVTSLNLDRRAQAAVGVVAVVPGAAGAFRRRALVDVGGYPTETLVEDMDLTVMLLRAGWHVPYEPRAVARTEAPERARDVLAQRRRWAFGTLQVVAKHWDSLLDPDAHRIGLVGLPWMVVSQVLLPLAAPLIDLYLLYLLVVGQWATFALVLGIGLALDLFVVGLAMLLDGEDLRALALTPLMRVVWRPLQLAAVLLSVNRWVHASSETWRRVRRHNTVPVAAMTRSRAA